MARPKIDDPTERRSEVVKSTLTVAEKLHVQEQAQAAGLSEAEYIRRRAVGYRVPSSRNPASALLVAEINRIGVNVNQLAAAAHMGRDFTQYWEHIAQEVEAVLGKVSADYDT